MLIEAFLYQIIVYETQFFVQLRTDNLLKKRDIGGGAEGNRTPVQKQSPQSVYSLSY